MNHKAVCRTVPATPGLLIIIRMIPKLYTVSFRTQLGIFSKIKPLRVLDFPWASASEDPLTKYGLTHPHKAGYIDTVNNILSEAWMKYTVYGM